MTNTDASARPSLYDRLDKALDTPGARPWLTRWLVVSMIVLGTAGLFALPLAFGRAPGLSDMFPWFVDNFHRFLVVHVNYSFVVFYLCVFAAIANITVHRLAGGKPKFLVLQYIAFRGTVIAIAGMFIPVFIVPDGVPVMSNYIPVIQTGSFYAALIILGASMGLQALMVVLNLMNRPAEDVNSHGLGIDIISLAGIASSIFYLLAFGQFLFAWTLLDGAPVNHQFNEDLFWAGGHTLQFVNVSLLIAAWYATSAAVFKRVPFNPMTVVVCTALLGLGAVATPLFNIVFEPFGGTWRQAFTDLQYIFAPVTLFVAMPMIFDVLGKTDKRWNNPGYVALLLSPLVFGIGGAMGLFVDGQDTRTPAHYHGMIAGITLAFMGLYYTVFLPLIHRRIQYPRLALASVWLFGISQALASTGLFLAGGHGAQRKTAGAEQGLSTFTAKVGMGLNGGAGLLAIIGGALFVWVVVTAFISKREQQ